MIGSKRLFCGYPVKVAFNSKARKGNRGVAKRRLRLRLPEDPSANTSASTPNAARTGAAETVADFGFWGAAGDLALTGPDQRPTWRPAG